jgi:hypothetical protein
MSTEYKDNLGRFGRAFALLLNRTLMYEAKHPYIKQSVAEVVALATPLLGMISPLVFILNRDQFYIDEEVLDPRINISRTAALFKGSGLQSICFENGLQESELMTFAELFGSMTKMSSVEMVKEDLIRKSVFNIKVNHVVFKKVTADDQVVSRDALKNVTPFMDSDDPQHRKQFMETLMESVLSEELASTLNITSLMENPQAFTRKMIEADLAGALQIDSCPPDGSPGTHEGTGMQWGAADENALPETRLSAGGAVISHGPPDNTSEPVTGCAAADGVTLAIAAEESSGRSEEKGRFDEQRAASGHAVGGVGQGTMPEKGPGVLLLHQIEVMNQEVEKHLQGHGEVSLSVLTHSIFEMKKQLMENIHAQKALGIAYANESAIVAAADKMTDQVLMELIKEEYKAGAVPPRRMAHLIVRLIPEAKDLKRLLPQIKRCLLQQGMVPSDYFTLIQTLREDLQSEELTRILQESSESVGLDGDMLIEEVKRNPVQAAELIYLASEIRKSGVNENALSDILVDYVERLGNQMAQAAGGDSQGTDHLTHVITDVESTILKKLGGLNINEDLLRRMEERINERMEAVIDSMRVQWLQHQPASGRQEPLKPLSILQTLEQNVSSDEELSEILKTVRVKADAREIEENDFIQIHEEILRQVQLQKAIQDKQSMDEGVLSSEKMMFILEKEIARAARYGTAFVTLAFTFVKATPQMTSPQEMTSSEAVLQEASRKLSSIFRESDYIGRMGKNKIMVLLPMASPEEGKNTLTRVLRLLHAAPLDVRGVPVMLRVAGVAAHFDAEHAGDAQSFVKQLSRQLAEMAARIRNIQALL